MDGIRSDLIPLIKAQLAQYGFKPIPMDRGTVSVASSEWRFQEADISRLYSRIRREMYGKPMPAAESRGQVCKLGDEVKNLASLVYTTG